jgi:DNA-binding response OmpR family regulator
MERGDFMIDNKRCILIADDEPKMVLALRDFFRANGFCVLEAKNGIEAFEVFCLMLTEK